MDRRTFIAGVAGGFLAEPFAAEAQHPTEMRRIGFLSAGSGSAAPGRRPAFIEALANLGWIEGKSIVVEWRYADNRLEHLAELAAELVSLKPDVIVAAGTLAPLALKRATGTIPIVMLGAGAPVESGLITSLARPNGNITGQSLDTPEVAGKRLQLLKEILPAVSRVAVVWDAANPHPTVAFKETKEAALTLGIEILSFEVRGPADVAGALELVARQRPDALITIEDPLTVSESGYIVKFAARNHLPAMYGLREFVDAGGLIAYGANLADLARRAASYVDKILRGAKPGDLPIEQPTKFELIINLKSAKALGLTIPQSLLLRADEVIE
jgi:putative tryptophan/tyrosine transport system substrate-binding protein